MYSQYDEQEHIKNFFGDTVGSFLDLGAADGIEFSNVYQLLLDGWSGVSVEPETQTFRALLNHYEKFGNNVEFVMALIDANPGFITFHENGQMSTTSEKHMQDWEWHRQKYNYDWKPITHYAITLNDVLKHYSSKNFDFISVDLEGQNHSVVTSTDWNLAPNCKLVCIEHDQDEQPLLDYMSRFGFKFYHRTSVNLLVSR